MDRGAWWATVHGATESWILLKGLQNNNKLLENCLSSDNLVSLILAYLRSPICIFKTGFFNNIYVRTSSILHCTGISPLSKTTGTLISEMESVGWNSISTWATWISAASLNTEGHFLLWDTTSVQACAAERIILPGTLRAVTVETKEENSTSTQRPRWLPTHSPRLHLQPPRAFLFFSIIDLFTVGCVGLRGRLSKPKGINR